MGVDMPNSMLSTLLAAMAASLAAPAVVGAQDAARTPIKDATPTPAPAIKSGHVEVAGISYFYEIRGHGEPLLLLHGGLGSIDMFQPILPVLVARRQIIGIDLQGHGRTTLGDR